MDSVEFQAEIENGAIKIPLEYRDRFSDEVTVILIGSKPSPTRTTFIDDLLDSPLRIPGFQPLTRDEAHAR